MLPGEHFNSRIFERGHHELCNHVFVSSVASFIEELELIEVWRLIFSVIIYKKSIGTISAMWP